MLPCPIMKLLLFVILTQYVVTCIASDYVIVERPEDNPRPVFKKPFKVYWNVPTKQCKSKRIPFELEKYGIIQNEADQFEGEQIIIMYDTGKIPAFFKDKNDESSLVNGGLPQEGNVSEHEDAFRRLVEKKIPNNFNGIGIIDFESWRPVFRQNYAKLVVYKTLSYEAEKKKHPQWREEWINAEAQYRFELAARLFMETTLSIAKNMRPEALWGYYGFPYCFNMDSSNMAENCYIRTREENDDCYWLWAESTALYPSVYSYGTLSSSQLAAMIRGRVRESSRVRLERTPILPYFSYKYMNKTAEYLSQADLSAALDALYNSDASGFVVWGSSSDVNTVEKCEKLLHYTHAVFGPAIAKYTKVINVIAAGKEYSNTEFEYTVENVRTDILVTGNVTSTVKPDASIESTTVSENSVSLDKDFDNYTTLAEHNEAQINNNYLNSSLLLEILKCCTLLRKYIDDNNNVRFQNNIGNTNNMYSKNKNETDGLYVDNRISDERKATEHLYSDVEIRPTESTGFVKNLEDVKKTSSDVITNLRTFKTNQANGTIEIANNTKYFLYMVLLFSLLSCVSVCGTCSR